MDSKEIKTLDGVQYARMIRAGTANLRAHAKDINDLNVFPIPDGDTGDNMLMTIVGGADAVGSGSESLSDTVRKNADGMLLSARGNSGVILSQFFEGIAAGFEGVESAGSADIVKALRCGVERAYSAVLVPTEGTMLTVMRSATESLDDNGEKDPEALLDNFIEEAKRTLEKTPDMLPVLKKAGVVDSGGAGLIYIMEGMLKGLRGEEIEEYSSDTSSGEQAIDVNLFTEDSVLEFGYCTELLLRLQRIKTDIATFDEKIITDFLSSVGDSVVCVRNGTVVKIHVHTMTPHKVLEFCQQFGEFLKLKIENMSLQHNNTDLPTEDKDEILPHKEIGTVVTCAGSGIRELFEGIGADVVVDGGQSMNPSTEDFLAAFRRVNADTVFVFPNNSNIILTARQAAAMYKDADVRVIESRTVGDGYAALSMLDSYSTDPDDIEASLKDGMEGVITAEISKSVRDTQETKNGDYIGFVGKDILASCPDRLEAACKTVDCLDFCDREICLIIHGAAADADEAKMIAAYIARKYPSKEVYIINGKQEIYDYILILE
ncbi:MAG: DAK2 domain-containing protein [Ruminococcaceae bacterium]|nr:DAK2 domain-containing protein [Oscillospiraceae bacterium]